MFSCRGGVETGCVRVEDLVELYAYYSFQLSRRRIRPRKVGIISYIKCKEIEYWLKCLM